MPLDIEPLNTSTTNPLAWLPVDTAQQLQATDYLLIAILAVSNSHQDLCIFTGKAFAADSERPSSQQ